METAQKITKFSKVSYSKISLQESKNIWLLTTLSDSVTNATTTDIDATKWG